MMFLSRHTVQDTSSRSSLRLPYKPTHAVGTSTGNLNLACQSSHRARLHSIFRRAVRDQLILTNPCEHTKLPKVVLSIKD